MNKLDDSELIKNFLAGDEPAFSELVQRHLSPVYNFLRGYIRDQSVLDDLVQETFLKVWKNLRRFDQSKKFKTWLFTIAKNTAFDWLKKKKTIPFSRFTNDEGYNQLEEVAEETILPDELLEKAEVEKNFEKYLGKLPEIYQTILKLRYQEDFSLKEITAILDISYNTIKSRHQRALVMLGKILKTKL